MALSLVIGFVHETDLPLQQEFQIAFVQVSTNRATHTQLGLVMWLCVDMFTQIHKFFLQDLCIVELNILFMNLTGVVYLCLTL